MQDQVARPLGPELAGWTPRPLPLREVLAGRLVRLEPFELAHVPDLHAAFAEDDGRMWDYMSGGPFADEAAYRAYAERVMTGADPLFFTIVDQISGARQGVAALMRFDPANGVIEVGHIAYAPRFQRTPGATEAMALLMELVFGRLGYRRYEWKCDDLNAASKRAALRFGFRYEGLFRQHMVVKGRNRDTAWFSMLDREWPARKTAFARWLDPANFDADGRQKRSLVGLVAEV